MADRGDEFDEEVARAVGGLLIELGEKLRSAGADGVRIMTAAEIEERDLDWFRTGWEERARTADREPDRPSADSGGKVLYLPQPDAESLPIVRAGDAAGRELMAHRPRHGGGPAGREESRGTRESRDP